MRGIIFLAGLAVVLAGAAAPAEEVAAQITVAGEGSAAAAPDQADLRLGVETQEPAAGAALAANSRVANRVIEGLKAGGVPPRAIRTSELRVQPVYRRTASGASREIEGYRVVNEVAVRVGDLDRLGALLDRAVANGANRIGAIRFAISDPTLLEAEARRAAVADATTKARTLAEAAGLALGPILSIRDAPGHAPPRPAFEARTAAMSASAPPIERGETRIRARVAIEWRLVPGD